MVEFAANSEDLKMYKLPEGVDYSYKAGVPGLYNEKGELVKKAEDMSAQELSTYESDYRRRRGAAQIKVDQQVNAILKAEQEAKRKAQQTPAQQTPTPIRLQVVPFTETRPKPLTADQKSNAEYQSLRTKDPEAAKKLGMEIWAKKYAGKFTVPSVEKGGSRIDVATPQQKAIFAAAKAKEAMPAVRSIKQDVEDIKAIRNSPSPQEATPNPISTSTPNPKPLLKKGDPGYEEYIRKRYFWPKPNTGAGAPMNNIKDSYDVVLDYLLSEGHADTVEEAHYVMMQMDSEYIQSIVEAPGEWFGGLRDRARASRDAQIRAMQPKVSPAGPSVTSPFAKPASRDDSGKLTTYGAGGGAAAERAGKSRAEVMRQGAKNLENKKPVNQGPDFGR